MKITIEHEGMKAVVEDEAVHDICDAIDLMEKALLEIGYGKQRINGGLAVKVKEIQQGGKGHV